MSEPIFRSYRGNVLRKHNALMDLLMARMTQDIEIGIKRTAGTPVDTGTMKKETRSFKSPVSNGYRVEVAVDYAAYQERGSNADGSKRVRKYTTFGTSAGWFQRAIDNVMANQSQYISEARRAVGL